MVQRRRLVEADHLRLEGDLDLVLLGGQRRAGRRDASSEQQSRTRPSPVLPLRGLLRAPAAPPGRGAAGAPGSRPPRAPRPPRGRSCPAGCGTAAGGRPAPAPRLLRLPLARLRLLPLLRRGGGCFPGCGGFCCGLFPFPCWLAGSWFCERLPREPGGRAPRRPSSASAPRAGRAPGCTWRLVRRAARAAPACRPRRAGGVAGREARVAQVVVRRRRQLGPAPPWPPSRAARPPSARRRRPRWAVPASYCDGGIARRQPRRRVGRPHRLLAACPLVGRDRRAPSAPAGCTSSARPRPAGAAAAGERGERRQGERAEEEEGGEGWARAMAGRRVRRRAGGFARGPRVRRERPDRQVDQQRQGRQGERPLEALLQGAQALALDRPLLHAVDLAHDRRRIGRGAGRPQVGAAGRAGELLEDVLVELADHRRCPPRPA